VIQGFAAPSIFFRRDVLLFAFQGLERTGSAPQSWHRIRKADQIGESGWRSLEKRLAMVLGDPASSRPPSDRGEGRPPSRSLDRLFVLLSWLLDHEKLFCRSPAAAST